MPAAERRLRQGVIDVLVEAARLRINQGTSGNASARWGDGMVITPSALPYDRLAPADLVHVAGDATVARRAGPAPSSEWRLHAGIYRARPEVGAVVHLHSPAATALACLRRDVPPFHYMVAVAGGHDIRCAGYHTFGTQDLADAAVAALEGRSACLLANHGQVALGPDPHRALALAVEVEALCEQYLRACAAGEPVLLAAEEMDRVLERFERYRAGTLD
jgi:L-fuculose-phosphate aldolase